MQSKSRGTGNGVVPVPNVLFDQLLPVLGDTELRVWLVICRQTAGWREGAELGGWRYKERDWISHAQLIKKTGRRSEAVSRAVRALVDTRLVVAEDKGGKPLPTAAERKRHLGRVYYKLAAVDNGGFLGKTRLPCHPAKAKTTTNT